MQFSYLNKCCGGGYFLVTCCSAVSAMVHLDLAIIYVTPCNLSLILQNKS